MPGYIYLLIFNKCKKPYLSGLNNSSPQLILTTRVEKSVFVVKPGTVECEKDSRGVAEKKLERQRKQKSVKNSWDEASLFLKMMYCTLLYNTKESDYSKLAVKTQTSNILFLFCCGIKCIVGTRELKGSTLGEICRKEWLKDEFPTC